VSSLRTAIHNVLAEDYYQRNAIGLQQAINKAERESRATDIIEQIVSIGKPVLRYETQLNFE